MVRAIRLGPITSRRRTCSETSSGRSRQTVGHGELPDWEAIRFLATPMVAGAQSGYRRLRITLRSTRHCFLRTTILSTAATSVYSNRRRTRFGVILLLSRREADRGPAIVKIGRAQV